MKFGRASQAAKTSRKDAKLTQQRMAMEDDLFMSRESISHQENGRHRVQPEVTEYFSEKHNDPWSAIEAASEYSGWGPIRLDGPAAEVNRMTAAVQSTIQMTEAIDSLKEHMEIFTIKPDSVSDKTSIEKTIQECLDVITALTQFVAVICKEYSINWLKMWSKHKLKLLTRGLITK
ncbi:MULTISPECIES: helix-turn-helix domain-containing protein [Bacillus]|uniref:helix-turn-helix domain-containing protein n=1 Tax=Bacillus TaxID=1386 RepID=UPI0009B74B80|nr:MULTISPECIES: helix-turn-helix domain-containing protein [Bacillus]ARC68722.1 hypothetical protein B34_01280 [Bacillus licheniformis]MCY8341176.1 helix-turn-helix domain-containing protein [Bacillus haynesii]MCY8641235.1 helix-turn-helix domain-containing protein [Bacillus haynesii]QEO07843.1 helix-turn-helix domain-containing protein [Bacillus paralicheniformis]